MVLLLIHGMIVGILVILGIVFLKGKGSFLIAGYNTAPKAEKEQIDEKTLCRYMGKWMFSFTGCFLVIMASDVSGKTWLLWLGLALVFVVGIGGAIYINTGNRLGK